MSEEERLLIDILTVVEDHLESLPNGNTQFQNELHDRFLEMLDYLGDLLVLEQDKRG
jgi:hypothetical protein